MYVLYIYTYCIFDPARYALATVHTSPEYVLYLVVVVAPSTHVSIRTHTTCFLRKMFH